MSKLLLFICLSIFFSCYLLTGAADTPTATPTTTAASAPPTTTVPAAVTKRCSFTIASTQKIAAVTPVGPIFKVLYTYASINSTKTTAVKSMLEADFFDNSIQYIEYNGTNCDVRYEFWSNQNYTGSYLFYTVRRKKSGRVTLSPYMSRAVSSYRFSFI